MFYLMTYLTRGSRGFLNFSCHKTIYFKIHWPLSKLHCKFVIIWWPKSENYWPLELGHYILEAFILQLYGVRHIYS